MLESLLITNRSSPIILPEDIGVYWRGGYYVGKIGIGDKIYAIVVSPKESGEAPATLQWKTSQTLTDGAMSFNDGWSNTKQLIDEDAELYPAAKYCSSLNSGGYSDWYLPSMDELELCYRYLKPTDQRNMVTDTGAPYGANGYNPSSIPIGQAYTDEFPTQTSVESFDINGNQSFMDDYYWSSTQYDLHSAWRQLMRNGSQLTNLKTTARRVRAVRRVLIG